MGSPRPLLLVRARNLRSDRRQHRPRVRFSGPFRPARVRDPPDLYSHRDRPLQHVRHRPSDQQRGVLQHRARSVGWRRPCPGAVRVGDDDVAPRDGLVARPGGHRGALGGCDRSGSATAAAAVRATGRLPPETIETAVKRRFETWSRTLELVLQLPHGAGPIAVYQDHEGTRPPPRRAPARVGARPSDRRVVRRCGIDDRSRSRVPATLRSRLLRGARRSTSLRSCVLRRSRCRGGSHPRTSRRSRANRVVALG